MEKLFKKWVILFVTVFAAWVMIGSETASAQQYFTFVGKVISISRGILSVEGDNGNVMYFAVGRNTIYVPTRLPAIGERVQVDYYFRRGHNVAYQVRILPAKTKT